MARYINADKLIENCEFFETEMEVKNAPTEDVVERNSVLEMLSKINNAVEDGDGFQYEEWVEYAKNIPSAENTAEWIDNKDVIEITQEIQHHYMCSKCGMYFERMTKYCPNCGAKMEESEETE